MKKSLFLLSAAALALASCSQEEVLDINTSKVDNNVITFRPRTGKASRSLDITTENLQSFKVLAFKGDMGTLEEGDAPREQYWPDWV
ncbi:MAG: fimbrillin family protein, partial [Duncaniella sp.]|nr:fimbrillin family protein [Duncaniella sp.]